MMLSCRFALAVALALLVLPLLVGRDASAQSSGDDRPAYVLSTASTGGAFHQGGVSLSALVKIKLLPDHDIDLTTKNSTGSMENIARLGDGTSDFAIVQGLLGLHARRGTGPATGLGSQRDLRAVTMLWPNVEHFIVRKNAAKSGTIMDLVDLQGQRMSFGQEGSAIESNRFLLGNLGMDISQDFDQAYMPFRSSAAAFRRGDINGLSLPASTPISNFIELMGSLGPDAAILNWTAEDLKKADSDLGLWSPLSIPAETYPGQTEAIETIAQPNFLAVRADVDDDVVYAITKAIFENLPFLKRLHRPFQFLTTDRAVRGLPVPLHPGALRYFQEIRLDMANTVMAEHDYEIFGSGVENTEEIRQEVRRGVVSLMTPEDGTSNQLVNELMDVLGQDDTLRLLPLKGKGTAYNLADLLYLSGVDVSVLQLDAMEAARKQDLFPDLTKNIRYITKWHDQEVHLLVQDDIFGLDRLRGKRVNFGPRGSGSEVTAAHLFNQHRIHVEQTSFSHDTALQMLKDGEIAGMVYVAGKPVPLFDNIEVRDGLRLLSLSKADDNSHQYSTTTFTEADYPTLVFGKRTIETIAVPSVLAAYNWSSESQRYQPIKAFIDVFFAHLSELQAGDRHPKWQEVDPSFDLDLWQRHQASEIFLRQSNSVNKSLGQGGPLVPPIGRQPSQPKVEADQPRPETMRLSSERPAAKANPRRPIF